PEADLITLNNFLNGTIITDSGRKFIKIPCDFNKVVSLKFGGVIYTIKTKDLIIYDKNDICVLSFYSIINSQENLWTVGDTFLKNVYSVFNISGPTVGFAQLVNN